MGRPRGLAITADGDLATNSTSLIHRLPDAWKGESSRSGLRAEDDVVPDSAAPAVPLSFRRQCPPAAASRPPPPTGPPPPPAPTPPPPPPPPRAAARPPPLARLESLLAERNRARSRRILFRIRNELDAEPNPGPWIAAARALHQRGLLSHDALIRSEAHT